MLLESRAAKAPKYQFVDWIVPHLYYDGPITGLGLVQEFGTTITRLVWLEPACRYGHTDFLTLDVFRPNCHGPLLITESGGFDYIDGDLPIPDNEFLLGWVDLKNNLFPGERIIE